ncbi:MAG: ADOP family duplicated permease [Gemmatimonadota bacterium]
MTRAPRWLRFALAVLAPPDDREHVLGDLDEGFAARRKEVGAVGAHTWAVREVARSAWPLLTVPGRWEGWTMTGLIQDVRSGLRIFRHAPGFAAVVVATLAIGVGGAAAVFSVVQGVLLSPLSFDDPDRVVMMWGQSQEYPRTPLTVGDYNVLADEVEAFAHVGASWSNRALILGEGEAEQVSVGWVTPDYFDVVGVTPVLGRTIEALEEDVAMISHGLWVRRYGADPSVLGRTLDLSGDAFEIVGVLPEGEDPNLTTFAGARAAHEVWRLQPPGWTQGDDRSVGWLRGSARLSDGVTLEQAQQEVDALFAQVNATVTERDGGTDLQVNLIEARTDLVGSVSRTLWVLLAAVLGVLLIAASNVAHLMLARGEARTAEIAVRTALGGTRGRLVRQLLIEGAVLASAGAVAGLAIAALGVRLMLGFAPASLPRTSDIALDGEVVLFALAVTLSAALVFAVVPALRNSRSDLTESLRDRSATMDPRRQRFSRGLIVGEVALSLALVTCTGLLIRSVGSLEEVDLGYDRAGVVTFSLEAPSWGDSNEEAAATMSAYLDEMTSIPGVRTAGFTNRIPLAGGLFTGTFRSDDMVAADAEPAQAAVRYVSPDYLDALGTPLVSGRGFRSDDGTDRVIIDQRSAELAFPGQNPIGRMVELSAIGSDPRLAEVIGVVAATRHHGVREEPVETLYFPMFAAANEQNFRSMAVRVAGDPASFVEPLRQAARRVSGDAVVARVQTMAELFERDVSSTRFASLLLALFGVVAVVLAVVGLHGVMAFSVRRRAREIGIRVVLGAAHGTLLRSSVRSGATLVAIGIVVGTGLSFFAGRLIGSLLYGVDPSDLSTVAAAAALVGVTGLLGAYVPARLILGVDPAVTLRNE